MSESAIVALILGILGLLGSGGVLGYKQFKKEAPVRQRDADIAVAEKSQQMAMSIADDLREDYTRLRTDLSAERDARVALTGRVDSLEGHIRELNGTIRTLREAIRIFSAAWDDLEYRWEHYRQHGQPPPRPYARTD